MTLDGGSGTILQPARSWEIVALLKSIVNEYELSLETSIDFIPFPIQYDISKTKCGQNCSLSANLTKSCSNAAHDSVLAKNVIYTKLSQTRLQNGQQ